MCPPFARVRVSAHDVPPHPSRAVQTPPVETWLEWSDVRARTPAALRRCERSTRAQLKLWHDAWAAHLRGDTPAPEVPFTVRLRVPGASGRPPYACTAASFVAWSFGRPIPVPSTFASPRVAA